MARAVLLGQTDPRRTGRDRQHSTDRQHRHCVSESRAALRVRIWAQTGRHAGTTPLYHPAGCQHPWFLVPVPLRVNLCSSRAGRASPFPASIMHSTPVPSSMEIQVLPSQRYSPLLGALNQNCAFSCLVQGGRDPRVTFMSVSGHKQEQGRHP